MGPCLRELQWHPPGAGGGGGRFPLGEVPGTLGDGRGGDRQTGEARDRHVSVTRFTRRKTRAFQTAPALAPQRTVVCSPDDAVALGARAAVRSHWECCLQPPRGRANSGPREREPGGRGAWTRRAQAPLSALRARAPATQSPQHVLPSPSLPVASLPAARLAARSKTRSSRTRPRAPNKAIGSVLVK